MYGLLISLFVFFSTPFDIWADHPRKLSYTLISTEINDDVTLPCNYQGDDPSACWYKVSDLTQVECYDGQQMTREDNMVHSSVDSKQRCGLKIEGVGPEHAGFYKFLNTTWNEHMEPEVTQHNLVQLSVPGYPEVDMESIWESGYSVTIIGELGNAVFLPCNIDPVERLWIRLKDSRLYTIYFPADTRITNIETGMRIEEMKPEDAGVYRCEKKNDPTYGSYVQLKLKGHTSETKIDVEVVKRVKIEDTVVLTCNVQGAPQYIVWYKDGDILMPEERTDIFLSAEQSKSILTIDKASYEHSGNYMCAPMNGESSSVDLRVTN